jgi:hypothetical protein
MHENEKLHIILMEQWQTKELRWPKLKNMKIYTLGCFALEKHVSVLLSIL